MKTTRLNGLTQLIKDPTRVTENLSTTIDLVFVNNLHRIASHGVQEFGASDHSIVFAIKKAGTYKAPTEIREAFRQRAIQKRHCGHSLEY